MPIGHGYSQEGYRRMYEAYRELGARKHNLVAKKLGINYRTAVRAWERAEPPVFPPIKDIFAGTATLPQLVTTLERVAIHDNTVPPVTPQPPRSTDRDEASSQGTLEPQTNAPSLATPASIQQAGALAVLSAQAAFVENLATESEVAGHQVRNAKRFAELNTRLLKGMETLVKAAEVDIAETVEHGKKVTLGGVLEKIDLLSRIIERNAGTFGEIVKNQRLIVGAPQQITENRNTGDSPDADQMDRKLANMLDMLSRTDRQQPIDVEVLPVPTVEAGNPVATDQPLEPNAA